MREHIALIRRNLDRTTTLRRRTWTAGSAPAARPTCRPRRLQRKPIYTLQIILLPALTVDLTRMTSPFSLFSRRSKSFGLRL